MQAMWLRMEFAGQEAEKLSGVQAVQMERRGQGLMCRLPDEQAEVQQIKRSDMTDAQALKEARKLYGKQARIERAKKPAVNEKTGGIVLGTHRVGYLNTVIVPFFSIQGDGMSWDEAFGKIKRGSK